MSRISRRKWLNAKFGILGRGGLTDAFDDMIKSNFRITDEEYDEIAGNGTDEDLDLLLTDKPTFIQRRKIIEMLNKYVKYD